MNEIKKQYRESKELAKKLMQSGMIGAYLKQLTVVDALQLQLVRAK